jgi:predicted nucleic acid-binding protein
MGVMLDTSVLIAAERERLDLEALLWSLEPQTSVAISIITAAELLHGVERANTAERKRRRSEYVEWLLRKFRVIDLTLDDAREYSRLWAALQSSGVTIGSHDLLLGATALRLRYRVGTLNINHFARIPNLDFKPETFNRRSQR